MGGEGEGGDSKGGGGIDCNWKDKIYVVGSHSCV